MPIRFHTTSTNRIVALSADSTLQEYQYLVLVHRRLQDLIMRFNLGVEKAFIEGGMAGLDNACTEAGLQRMHEKYAGWLSQGVTALRLVSCDFLSFDLSEDAESAAVFTYEKWVFVYADGREVPTQGSVDGYDVHWEEDGWKVDSVTFYAPNSQPG